MAERGVAPGRPVGGGVERRDRDAGDVRDLACVADAFAVLALPALATSAASSFSGTMPPTTTRTSPRPASASAASSLGTMRWSVASDEMPMTSTSSSSASLTTAGMLCQGGV
jgi:hypothetical protein